MDSKSFAVKIIGFLIAFSGWKAYAVILGVLLLCGLGLPLPEDISLVAAGILAGLGNISIVGAFMVGFLGVLIGDSTLFFAGRFLGSRIFQMPLFNRVFTPDRVAMAEKKVKANSKFICFTARFLPGLRAPIYLTSGILGVKPFLFILLDGLAALISVPIWIIAGWWFAHHLDDALIFVHKAQNSILIGVAIVITSYFIWHRWRRAKKQESKHNFLF